jgi:hypothetical protein
MFQDALLYYAIVGKHNLVLRWKQLKASIFWYHTTISTCDL